MKNLALVMILSGMLAGASRCNDDAPAPKPGTPLPGKDPVAGKAAAGGGANPGASGKGGTAGKGSVAGKGGAAGKGGGIAGKGGAPSPGKPPAPERCGKVTCDAGEVCCNASCGTCTKPGEGCTKQFCASEDDAGVDAGAAGEACGSRTCAAGMVCCNASCGVCTPPGFACTQQACVDDDDDPAAGAPFCGGFAGIDCPGSGVCEDDPSDSCDPNKGGADCGGRCRCLSIGLCVDGNVWDDSPGVCDCVPAVTNPCAAVLCPVGSRCEVKQVQCIRAPCPAQGVCVP